MAVLALVALTMRARLLEPVVTWDRGKSSTTYVETFSPIRCFFVFTNSQSQEPDVIPTRRQRNATIYTAPGELEVGQVIRMTRPTLGTYQITDVQSQFDGYTASHDECVAIQVSEVVPA